MKKPLLLLASLLSLPLVACGQPSGSQTLPHEPGQSTQSASEQSSSVDEKIYQIYLLYVDNGGTLTYEEWLASIKGEKGDKGDKGDQGNSGENGDDGLSAYEIFVKYHPEYTGTEEDWINDVARGNVCNLFGHEFDNGVVTKEASVGVNGEKTYTCSVCGHTYVETIPMLVPAQATIYTVDGIDYVNFGRYPQSHLSASNAELIAELNKIDTVNESGYIEYEGAEYARFTADTWFTTYTDSFGNQRHYCYSDGDEIVRGSTEYFVVEPIQWRVLKEENDQCMLLSSKILDSSRYTDKVYDVLVDDVTVHPNNYKHSLVRQFLNGAFLNSAFSEEQLQSVITTEVDNSLENDPHGCACENTLDKVFLLSQKETSSSELGFNGNSDRMLALTDYALSKARLEFIPNLDRETYWDKGFWLTRTPVAEPYYGIYYAYIVTNEGKSTSHGTSRNEHMNYVWSVAPSIQIQL